MILMGITQQKLRQITDNIAGTIYLSQFESQMMSTPFFNRLHDVYQSSTVYMTFPTNRTKRYEHCLGTMERAGEMLFSSVKNAEQNTQVKLIEALSRSFKTIVEGFADRIALNGTIWCNAKFSDSLNSALPVSTCTSFNKVSKIVFEGVKTGVINDVALDRQSVCFYGLYGEADTNNLFLPSFLYQCVLEAIRLAALFHDGGHPPFSHVIEWTMRDLYNRCVTDDKSFVKKKADRLSAMIKPFLNKENRPTLLLPQETKEENDKVELHEAIGLKMLQYAFLNVLTELFCELNTEKVVKIKTIKALYYVTVVEFTYAILLEKTPLFTALHRIIDGPVDADRMDYIVRDTQNAGVDWGFIPYERIIYSAKLVMPKMNTFAVAFPEKMTDDIDDLLIMRYKVFARINYHHRAVKTSQLLQKAVKLLAEDYLRSRDDERSICPEIQELWEALGFALGTEATENKVAKWNDSWLISVLHSALICLSDEGTREELRNDRPGRSEEDIQILKNSLEEVLLNHKHYYTLLKRQKDAGKVMDGVLKYAGLTKQRVNYHLEHEYLKLMNTSGNESQEAVESLLRIQQLQSSIQTKADFDGLYYYFGVQSEDIIKKVLDDNCKNGKIKDYIISPNRACKSLGISVSPKDTIYLYSSKGCPYRYDIHNTILPILQDYRAANLWMNVCVNLKNPSQSDVILEELTEEICTEIGHELKEEFDHLFPPPPFSDQE